MKNIGIERAKYLSKGKWQSLKELYTRRNYIILDSNHIEMDGFIVISEGK